MQTALAGYVKIKFQAEDPDEPPAKAVMQRFDAVGLPDLRRSCAPDRRAAASDPAPARGQASAPTSLRGTDHPRHPRLTMSRRAPTRISSSASDGRVRFDRVSRALYSTDASVYQIVPLGVVVPRTRETTSCAPSRSRARHGVPITARGGGTSQAGQAIGAGLSARHLEVPQPRPRGERRRALGPGRAGLRARRAERAAASRTACASRPTSRPPAAPRSAA